MKMEKIIRVGLLIILIIFAIQIKVLAMDITSKTEILLDEVKINKKITDNSENTYITISNESTIKIKSEENIDGLYIVYEYSSKSGTLSSNRNYN